MGLVEFESLAEKSSGDTLYAVGNGHLSERSGRHRHIQSFSTVESKEVDGLLKSMCVEDIVRN